jgi:CDP-paratose 2-epimerase
VRGSRRVLVTGSSGLIGSEAVEHFDRLGDHVLGIDNNMRADFFGPKGDTTWNLRRLRANTRRFEHHALDIRDRAAVLAFVAEQLSVAACRGATFASQSEPAIGRRNQI